MTRKAKPPRAVFLPFMMGHHFGVPYHRDLQRQIILECFDHVVRAQESGEIRFPEITWAQARNEGIEIERLLGLRKTSR